MTSGMLSWRAWPTVDLEPRMHITADGRRLKLSQAHSQPMVVLYATSLISASFEARCLGKVLVSGL